MKIEFKSLPEQVELIKAMGAKDTATARQAQELFASLLSPTIGPILQAADTTSLVYRDITFNEDEDPSFPLELFANVPQGYFTIWSQGLPGGLPTNTIHQPIDEIKFTTYRLDSAISYLKKYARRPRLDVVGKALERLLQEILLKTSRNAWAVILAGLANASHTVNGTAKKHVVRAQTAGKFTLDDMNKLFTLVRRFNMSWANTSPVGSLSGLTDLVISPEIKEQLRTFAYNPINTAGAKGAASAAGDVVTLPEAQRAAIFASAGVQQIFNVNLIEMVEFGVGQIYNTLFSQFAGSTAYTTPSGGSSASFTAASEEIVLGLDLTKDFAYRALGVNEDYQSTFTLQPDDQWVSRSEKIGFYGHLTEGRLLLDTRPLLGLIV